MGINITNSLQCVILTPSIFLNVLLKLGSKVKYLNSKTYFHCQCCHCHGNSGHNSYMLKELCVFLLVITNQYLQFSNVTLRPIFINNLVTAVENLYNSYSMLNNHECLKLKYVCDHHLLEIFTSSYFFPNI